MFPKEFENNSDLYEYLITLISPEKRQKIETLVSYRTNFIVPVFEDVYQYRNAGAIVRSMEAFGFQSLYALENRNSFIPENSVSRGAIKWIDIHYMPSEPESLLNIKEKGYQLVAVSPEEDATNIQDFEINAPLAIIFGTEFEGITQETLNMADTCIKIPMIGFTQSLNVSVAAAICFYELRNKLEKSNVNWRLSEEEILTLKTRWAINSISSGNEIAHHYINKLKI